MKRSVTAPAVGRNSALIRAAIATYVTLLVVLPLAALTWHGLRGGPVALWHALTAPVAVHALALTAWTSACTAIVNAVMGTATAWVLVRYDLPGKSLLSALVDLPFAIPTLVAGIVLAVLLGPESVLGNWLATHGIRAMFAPPAIILALLFVTMPFVVRAVEPVLLELDPSEEEAARLLGAGSVTTFVRVVLPALLPAIVSGAIRSFARALAEFGSVVIVAGNIPFRTLTAPVFIFGEVESGRADIAAAVSVVLLAASLGMVTAAQRVERFAGLRRV